MRVSVIGDSQVDGVIAVDGGPGTLSELGFAGVYDRPIAGLDTHVIESVHDVEMPAEAVAYVESPVGTRSD